jgi:TPR repeat protein
MRWYRRAARAGERAAAWNLAMEYRLRGKPRRYLHWIRTAASLGDDDAIRVLAEIERRRRAGQRWTMMRSITVDRTDVTWMLSQFRDGELSAAELIRWAEQAHRRETVASMDPPNDRALAEVVAELANGVSLTPQRARELCFKLS